MSARFAPRVSLSASFFRSACRNMSALGGLVTSLREVIVVQRHRRWRLAGEAAYSAA
jgi:hypothetical protein